MNPLLARLALLCLMPLSACASSAPLLDVQVVDLDQGGTLPRTPYSGREYIAGQPGHRFSVSMRNLTGERVLAVLSVDGVNAISGQTAGASQAGYVLEPWQQVEIRGWRKSYSDVAEFYFTHLADSYAARTGRPQNVGVVGVAAFRERRREPIAYQPAPMIGAMEKSTADAVAGAASARHAESNAPAATAQQIGTGHGQRRYDPVTQTEFERNSSRPDQQIALYYDSWDALVSRGVIHQPAYSQRPEPFPIGFAADPH
jgi:hypothetical protein